MSRGCTLKGNPLSLEGPELKVGDMAPDAVLRSNLVTDYKLSEGAGKARVYSVVPSLDTPVCAESVRKFNRYGNGRDDLGLLMVSYDLPFAHKRFQQEHGLDNVVGLSAIRHQGFGENYGVQIMDGPLAGMFSRAVLVLDENNTVVHREHIEDITQEPDYEAAFRALGIEVDE